MLHAFTGTLGSQRSSVMRTTNVATYSNVSVTAGGTIGTYGASWTQVVASTPFDVTAIRIFNATTAANSAARGDIAVAIAKGTASNEVEFIGPLLFGGRPQYSSYTLPVFIPFGTRLSLKTAAGVASRALNWSVDLYGSPNRDTGSLPTRWGGFGHIVSSGVGAHGTLVTAGTPGWGSWTDLGSMAGGSLDLWLPMAAVATGTAITALNWRTQFAIGSTSEAATMVTNATGVFEGPMFTGATTENFGSFNVASNPVKVGLEDVIYAPRASGVSLSARALCSGTPDANVMSCAMLGALK